MPEERLVTEGVTAPEAPTNPARALSQRFKAIQATPPEPAAEPGVKPKAELPFPKPMGERLREEFYPRGETREEDIAIRERQRILRESEEREAAFEAGQAIFAKQQMAREGIAIDPRYDPETGKQKFDLAELRRELTVRRATELAPKMKGADYMRLSPKERFEVEEEAAKEIGEQERRLLLSTGPELWIDTDAPGTTEALAKVGEVPIIGPALRGVGSVIVPKTRATYTRTGIELEQETGIDLLFRLSGALSVEAAGKLETVRESGALGTAGTGVDLMRSGHYGPAMEKFGEALSTAAEYWRGSTPEAARRLINNTRQGRFVFQELGHFYEAAARDGLGIEDKEVLETIRWFGHVQGFGLDIINPDVLGIAIASFGALFRAGSLVEREASLAATALRRAKDPEVPLDSIVRELEATSPSAALLFQARLAKELDVPESVITGINARKRELAAIGRKLDEARVAEREARGTANEARAAATRARLEIEHAQKTVEDAHADRIIAEWRLQTWKDMEGPVSRQANKAQEGLKEVASMERDLVLQHRVFKARHGATVKKLEEASKKAEEASETLRVAEEALEAAQDTLSRSLQQAEARLASTAKARDLALRDWKKAAKDAKKAKDPTTRSLLEQTAKDNESFYNTFNEQAAREASRLARIKLKSHKYQMAVRDAKEARKEARVAYREALKHRRELREANPEIFEEMKEGEKALRKLIAARLRHMSTLRRLGLEGEADLIEGMRLEGERLAVVVADAKSRQGAARKVFQDVKGKGGKDISAANKEVRAHEKTVTDLLKTELRAETLAAQQERWRRVAGEMADDIDVGLRRLRSLPAEETRFKDFLGPATVRGGEAAEEGARTVDPTMLKATMADEFTQPAVDWVIKRGDPEASSLLARVLSSPRNVDLTPDEVFKLQGLREGLLRARKLTDPDARAIQTVEMIALGRKDPDLARYAAVMGTTTQTVAQTYRSVMRRIEIATDPILSRVGDVSEDVMEVMRAAENLALNISDELHGVQYQAVLDAKARLREVKGQIRGRFEKLPAKQYNDAVAEALYKYIDSNEALPMYGRTSFLNRDLWAKLVHVIRSDPRVGKYEEMLREARRAGLPEPPDEVSKVLRGLSRMWIPPGVRGEEPARALYSYARHLLQGENPPTTFREFAELMRRRTFSMFGETDSAATAVAIGAKNVTHGAVVNHTGNLLLRAVGGQFSPAEVTAFNRVLEGQFHRAGDIEVVTSMFSRLGLPMSEKLVQETADAAEVTLKMVQGSADPSGQAIFASHAMWRLVDDSLGKATKALTEHFVAPRDSIKTAALAPLMTYLRWWRTSVVTGMISPNPRYWVNNIFGDFSQMWHEFGPVMATRLSFQNLAVNVPWLGRRFQNAASEIAMSAKSKGILPTSFEALINPHINRFWLGKEGHVITPDGRVLPYDELRRWVAEDGILDTFVQEDFIRQVERVTPGGMRNAVRDWNNHILHFGSFVQQRQRAHLYLDLLRQGATRAEARRRSLDALYDWRHGIAEWEARWLSKFVPFWRFWRLAMKQSWRAFTEPLTKPTETMTKALIGQSGFGRIRAQGLSAKALNEVLRPEWDEAHAEDVDEYDALAEYFRPEWVGVRPVLGVEKNDEARVAYYQSRTGRTLTHHMTVAPPLTLLDSTDFIMSMLLVPVMAMAPKKFVPHHWPEKLLEPSLGMTVPWLQTPIERTMGDLLGGVHLAGGALGAGFRQPSASSMRLRPSEYFALQQMETMLPGAGEMVWQDPETGELRGSRTLVSALRYVPFVGTQLPGIADAAWFGNPEWVNGPGSALLRFARNWTNLGRTYDFDPRYEAHYRVQELDRIRQKLKAGEIIESQPGGPELIEAKEGGLPKKD